MKRVEPRKPGEGMVYKYVLSSAAAVVAETGMYMYCGNSR